MAAAPLVSIIVPAAPTERCRQAVAAQSHPACELLVGDDRAAAAGGDLLALLDADAAPHPDWLAAGLACLDADPTLGVVAPLRFAADHPLMLAGAGASLTWHGDRLSLASGVPYEFAALPTAVVYAPRCGLLVRRVVLAAVGPLDLSAAGGGDVELGLRAWARGWRVGVCPDAWVDGAQPERPAVAGEHIRLALSYFPARQLRAWLRRELFAAPVALLAWGSHPHRLRDAWQLRRRFAVGAAAVWPLLAPTWASTPCRAARPAWRRPEVRQAGAALRLDGRADAAQLGFGWYAAAGDGARDIPPHGRRRLGGGTARRAGRALPRRLARPARPRDGGPHRPSLGRAGAALAGGAGPAPRGVGAAPPRLRAAGRRLRGAAALRAAVSGRRAARARGRRRRHRVRRAAMKLLHVYPYYGAELTGGAEVYEYELTQQLAARGAEVHVLTTCTRRAQATSAFSSAWPRQYPAGRSREGAVTVHRFPVSFALPASAGYALSRAVFRALEARGGRGRPRARRDHRLAARRRVATARV